MSGATIEEFVTKSGLIGLSATMAGIGANLLMNSDGNPEFQTYGAAIICMSFVAAALREYLKK